MPITTDAGRWLAEQRAKPIGHDPAWGARKVKTAFGMHQAQRAKYGQSVKEFVEAHRGDDRHECIFVPYARKDSPAKVTFCGKTISAARYMALLTFGAPRQAGTVVRHLCGNGHLSCINPKHLEWGSEANNKADAAKHRGCETVQDKIHAANGRK